MNFCGEKSNAQSEEIPSIKFSGKQILVAHSRERIPWEEGVDPFRFVVPEEKRQARWIREVIEVKLIKID